MRKIVSLVLTMLLILFNISLAQTNSNEIIDLILSSYSARQFSEKPVTDKQIEQILKCGIKAPSGRNKQPWRFTVVKDITKVKSLFRNINSGNVVIIISGLESGSKGWDYNFDCALATENMYLAAQSLGLGARIYTGPIRRIDEDMSNELEIPDGYQVTALLKIGNLDPDSDAVSSASPRKNFKDVVNYTE